MAAEKGNQYALENEGGRPTKYKKEFAEQAYKLCLLGMTDKELGVYFEVDESTIVDWRLKHKEFSLSVKRGKEIADAQAAESFFKRVNGYNYDEVTFEKIDGMEVLATTPDGEIKKDPAYKKKIVTKHLAPDAGAALNWLKNRQKDKWRDKHNIEIDYEKLTDEQLDFILENLKNANNDTEREN